MGFFRFAISVFFFRARFAPPKNDLISENHDVSEKRPRFWMFQKIDPEISAIFFGNF